MVDDERTRLAENLRRRREQQDLTQQELAERSGVPRPTLAHLESGQGNPTLSVLSRVARALDVGIEALVSAPQPVLRVIPRAELPWEERGGVELCTLGSQAGFHFERWKMPRSARLERAARGGERRVLVCEAGELEITVHGRQQRLRPGDVALIDAALRPTFESRGRGVSIVYSLTA
jgi:transcriptional regulator with XRE-family HTH domain